MVASSGSARWRRRGDMVTVPWILGAVIKVVAAVALLHVRGGFCADDDAEEKKPGADDDDTPLFNQFNQGVFDFFTVPDFDEKNDEAKRIGREYACGICHALVTMVDMFFTEQGKLALEHITNNSEDKNLKYKSQTEQMKAAARTVCANVKQGKTVMQDEALRVCNNVIDIELENMIDDKSTGTSLDQFCQEAAMICEKTATREHINKASKIWGETLEEEERKREAKEKAEAMGDFSDIDDSDYEEDIDDEEL